MHCLIAEQNNFDKPDTEKAAGGDNVDGEARDWQRRQSLAQVELLSIRQGVLPPALKRLYNRGKIFVTTHDPIRSVICVEPSGPSCQ
jgi:hypothetical protein